MSEGDSDDDDDDDDDYDDARADSTKIEGTLNLPSSQRVTSPTDTIAATACAIGGNVSILALMHKVLSTTATGML